VGVDHQQRPRVPLQERQRLGERGVFRQIGEVPGVEVVAVVQGRLLAAIKSGRAPGSTAEPA
jgi:hypothetical protein